MIGAARAAWRRYRIDRQTRGAIVAAVQFMEGQHMATDIAAVFKGFPCARPRHGKA